MNVLVAVQSFTLRKFLLWIITALTLFDCCIYYQVLRIGFMQQLNLPRYVKFVISSSLLNFYAVKIDVVGVVNL